MKIINLKLERFRDRVEFSGNPGKYDVSVTLKNVRIEDEGLYNCYIMNPPDRHRGHGRIHLQVLMEGEGQAEGSRAAVAAVQIPDRSWPVTLHNYSPVALVQGSFGEAVSSCAEGSAACVG